MKKGREGADREEVRIAIRALTAILVVATAACSTEPAGLTVEQLRAEPILSLELRGAGAGSITDQQDGSNPMATVLFDVEGDWRQVAVELAVQVREAGWTVENVNCVATGHDVIGRKELAGEWVLLESGAGTRGAGIILRRDPAQQPPQAFAVTGSCPSDLVRAAGG